MSDIEFESNDPVPADADALKGEIASFWSTLNSKPADASELKQFESASDPMDFDEQPQPKKEKNTKQKKGKPAPAAAEASSSSSESASIEPKKKEKGKQVKKPLAPSPIVEAAFAPAAKPQKKAKASSEPEVPSLLLSAMLREPMPWFDYAGHLHLPDLQSYAGRVLPYAEIEQWRQKADVVYDDFVGQFEKREKKATKKRGGATGEEMDQSDRRFLKTVMSAGTLSDRVAALNLMAAEHPLAKMQALDQLLTICGRPNRQQALQAVESVKDLFVNELLPPSRKLFFFRDQPLAGLASLPLQQQHAFLCLWHVEEQIKKRYMELQALLARDLQDPLAWLRSRALAIVSDMFIQRPEGEQALLSLLCNKLGDTDRKVAAKVLHLLTLTLRQHPAMRTALHREMDAFLRRAHLSDRAAYLCVLFLSQIKLERTDAELARGLVRTYIDLFQARLKQAQLDDKAKKAEEKEEKKEKKNSNGKTKGGKGKFKKNDKHADKGKEKEKDEKKSLPGSVNAKLLGAILAGVHRAIPYLRLNSSQEISELEAQADVLFSLTRNPSLHSALQALALLFHICVAPRDADVDADAPSATSTQVSTGMADRFYRSLYEVLLIHSAELGHSSRQSLFLHLMLKALQVDPCPQRVAAFVKRLLQVCLPAPPNFICACLLLLSELIGTQPSLSFLLTQPEEHDADSASAAADADGFETVGAGAAETKKKQQAAGAAVHVYGAYDSRQRDPLLAGAQRSCLWELTGLSHHWHPTVTLFATTLLSGDKVKYDGEPLEDFSASRFLDRFSFRNPKKLAMSSSAAHAISHLPSHLLKRPVASAATSGDVPHSTAEFLKRPQSSIPLDQMFFYKFMQDRAAKQPQAKVDAVTAAAEAVPASERDESDEEEDFAMDLFEKELEHNEGKMADVDADDEMDDLLQKELAEDEKKEKAERREKGEAADVEEEEAEDAEAEAAAAALAAEDEEELGGGGEGEEEEGEPVSGEEEDMEAAAAASAEEGDEEEPAWGAAAEEEEGEEEGAAAGKKKLSVNALKRKFSEMDGFGSEDEGDEDGDIPFEFSEGGDNEPMDLDAISDEEEEDGISNKKRKAKKALASSGSRGSIFADADEFAQLLERSGESDIDPKQARWERQKERGPRKSGKRGGSSSRGRPSKRARRH